MYLTAADQMLLRAGELYVLVNTELSPTDMEAHKEAIQYVVRDMQGLIDSILAPLGMYQFPHPPFDLSDKDRLANLDAYIEDLVEKAGKEIPWKSS